MIKDVYAIISSMLLFVFILTCGWLTDKYSSSSNIFNIGVAGMVIFSIPLYFMMSSREPLLIILSQVIILIYASMVLCNSSFVFFYYSKGHTTALSVGFNIASVSIGGVTPLVISYLLGIHLVYVGVFLSLSGLTLFLLFLSSGLKKYEYTK